MNIGVTSHWAHGAAMCPRWERGVADVMGSLFSQVPTTVAGWWGMDEG